MNQVKITPELLIQFSLEYGKVPIVSTASIQGIPFSHQVLAYWATELESHNKNDMYGVFTGWLCGRNEFVNPDMKGGVVMAALADALRPCVEAHHAKEDR